MERISKNPYVYGTSVDADRYGLKFDESNPESRSKTQQHFAEECDINKIVAKIQRGQLDPLALSTRTARYGDFTSVGDFQSLSNRLANAKSLFESLPLDLRVRFNNDPVKYYDFIADPANAKECVDLGIFDKSILPKEEEKPADDVPAGDKPATGPAGDKPADGASAPAQ